MCFDILLSLVSSSVSGVPSADSTLCRFFGEKTHVHTHTHREMLKLPHFNNILNFISISKVKNFVQNINDIKNSKCSAYKQNWMVTALGETHSNLWCNMSFNGPSVST